MTPEPKIFMIWSFIEKIANPWFKAKIVTSRAYNTCRYNTYDNQMELPGHEALAVHEKWFNISSNWQGEVRDLYFNL